MTSVRVIPVLLLRNSGLVKTRKFTDAKYVGDPINAVKIFNEKEVDELVFLDITATIEKREPNFKTIADIASECFMPLSYGGGISNIEQVKKLFSIGVEKVVINTAALLNPLLIKEISEMFGSQSVVVCIDVKKNFFGKYEAMIQSGKKSAGKPLIALIQEIIDLGAGEIILNAIDKDGTLSGFDYDLIKTVSANATIPLVALGGASSLQDFSKAIAAGASAVAAGSFFIFHGKHRAVLISYPFQSELKTLFTN